MKVKSAQYFRHWYKTNIQQIDDADPYNNENFVGTYYPSASGKIVKGFFHMYHADKPDIALYLPSLLKIAEDGQAIYEFIQNAVDCDSSHFYIFYNENYFLAINNGKPFDQAELRSVLNIGQTTKGGCDKIGRFGIGFKLIHRLVGKNEGVDELVHQYKGPILFSWSKPGDLEALIRRDEVVSTSDPKLYESAPFLLKILLTNFPVGVEENVRDLNYKYRKLFPREELNELIDFLNDSLRRHPESIRAADLNRGSLFFLKLGEGKKEKLDSDYEYLKKGVQYSMNTLKRLQKIYINSEDISKQALELEEFEITKDSSAFKRINPEHKDCNIRVKFGYYSNYKQRDKLRESPNFYKYFPLGDETNGFSFIVHCDSFSNESNRRKLQQDEVNKRLFPEISRFLIERLNYYKENDRLQFLKLYTSILLSDIPEKQNNNWLKPIFYDSLLAYLKTNIPTARKLFSDKSEKVKINGLSIPVHLSDVGLTDLEWFEWDFRNDPELVREAMDGNKLNIPSWNISDIIENAASDSLNNWIAGLNAVMYTNFLLEIEKSTLSPRVQDKLCDVRLFRFLDGKFYAVNDLASNPNLVFSQKKTMDISKVLQKLGFIVSERDISLYNVIYAALSRALPGDKRIYDAIAERCGENKLSALEKKRLFKCFINKDTKFEDVSEGTLKHLPLFSSNDGKVIPLCDLLDASLVTPEWLNFFKIRNEEYFPDLKKYMLSDKDIFSRIIVPFWNNIVSSVKDISSFYRDVKKYYDLGERDQDFVKQRFVYVDSEQGFLSTSDIFYHVELKGGARYKQLKDVVYRLAGVFIPAREVLPFLSEAPFVVNQSEFSDYFLDPDEALSQEEVLTLLKFDDISRGRLLEEYTIQKKDDLFYLAEKKDTVQVWIPPSNREVRTFLNSLPLPHIKLFPAELEDYCEKAGIVKGEDLYNVILNSISIDEYQDVLINILRYEGPKRLFLLKLTHICLKVGHKYDKEAFEYKVLSWACMYLQEEDYPGFREKIVVRAKEKDYKLSQIPSSADEIRINETVLSLAKILPDEYQNGRYLNELLLVFKELNVPEEKLGEILGISVEPTLEHVFTLLFENYQLLENEHQLAFLLLYGKEIDSFLLDTLSESYSLNNIFYTTYYSFIREDSILDKKYKGIEVLLKLPYIVNDGIWIAEAPYFNANHLVSDFFKKERTEKENLDLLDFLFSLFAKRKEDFEKQQLWNDILGFEPMYLVYPDEYAMEKEQLPAYVKGWLAGDEGRILFLKEIGVWTNGSAIVELRKCLRQQSFAPEFKAADEGDFMDEKILCHTLAWMESTNLLLETLPALAALTKLVSHINFFRDNENKLLLRYDYDVERLESESEEWDMAYYRSWKLQMDGEFLIYLYPGVLPVLYTINEMNYYFGYSTNGDVAILGNNHIYVNRDADIKQQLGSLAALENKFTIEHLLALYQHQDSAQVERGKATGLEKEVDRLRKVIWDMEGVNDRSTTDTTLQEDEYYRNIQEQSEYYLFNFLSDFYSQNTVRWMNYDDKANIFCESWQAHDFEILDHDGKVLHYIDCKGTPEEKPTFYLTKNEWDFFLHCTENNISYQIYRVYNLNGDVSHIHIDNLWNWLQTGRVVPYLTATETIKGGRIFLTLR